MRWLLLILFGFWANIGAAQSAMCEAPSQVWQVAFCELGAARTDIVDVDTAFTEQQGYFGPDADALSAVYALSVRDLVGFIDWKSDTENIIWVFEKLLVKANLPKFTNEELAVLNKVGPAAWGASVPMEVTAPLIETFIRQRGAALLYVDTGSDSYGYVITFQDMYDRWIYVRISDVVGFTPASDDVQRLGFGGNINWRVRPRPVKGQ